MSPGHVTNGPDRYVFSGVYSKAQLCSRGLIGGRALYKYTIFEAIHSKMRNDGVFNEMAHSPFAPVASCSASFMMPMALNARVSPMCYYKLPL